MALSVGSLESFERRALTEDTTGLACGHVGGLSLLCIDVCKFRALWAALSLGNGPECEQVEKSAGKQWPLRFLLYVVPVQ